jgi:hypothetical protein
LLVQQETNIYLGIEYNVAGNLYGASYTSGKGTWHLGWFASLDAAIQARAEWIEKRNRREEKEVAA